MTINPASVSGSFVIRFGDIEVLRYAVPSFETLSLDQKLFVYHLSRATTAGRDIFTDQNGRLHLRLRSLLESIYVHYRGDRSASDFVALEDYLRRVWFASGVYHHYGEHKLKIDFDEAFLRQASDSASDFLPDLQRECLDEICRLIFDPDDLPIRTSADTENDIVRASSVNYYQGLSRQDAEAYYQTRRKAANAPTSPGLNTRLVCVDGKIQEEYWRSGEMYGALIDGIVCELEQARNYAGSVAQQECIDLLLSFYRTGDLQTFDQYSICWVSETDNPIDFINGFIETYQDPLGLKGSWEGMVQIRDHEASAGTRLLSYRASWFEANAPIDDRYKKKDPRGVSACIVHTAMLGGDSYPATPIGINLPNADSIRAQYGSKSVTIENIHDAYEHASRRSGMDEAFIADPIVLAMLREYGSITDRLHTDLHECLGHGSGQLAPNVSPDALGPWHSTIEEARADLFALYFIADEEMIRLGLLPSPEAYQAAYYRYMLNGLVTQLVRIEPGKRIEETHMRNRALIARYVLESAQSLGAMQLIGVDLTITDYPAIRCIIAQLLREIQRIKSEGDTGAAQYLIRKYAIEVPTDLHTEVLRRHRALGIAPYRGFVNPRYFVSYGRDGNISDIRIDYTEGYDQQMLRYSQITAPARNKEIARSNSKKKSPEEAETTTPNYEDLTAEEQAVAKHLRASLRRRMDGAIAAQMRTYGIKHKINFGVTRHHLDELANDLPASAPLARYLLTRHVRELPLLALRLFPASELTQSEAYRMAIKAEADPELRNELPALLFDRVRQSARWAFYWLENDLPPHSIAYTTIARAVSQTTFVPTNIEVATLVEMATNDIASEEQHHANAAALLLKRIGRLSPSSQELVLSSLNLHYHTDRRPSIREYIEDITFDIKHQ